MKASGLIVLTALGVALALPVAAHHYSPMDVDIGDEMGNHEATMDGDAMPAGDQNATEHEDSSPGTMDGTNTRDPLGSSAPWQPTSSAD